MEEIGIGYLIAVMFVLIGGFVWSLWRYAGFVLDEQKRERRRKEDREWIETHEEEIKAVIREELDRVFDAYYDEREG